MKKTKIAGICLIVLILVAFVSVPVYNNYCAYNVEKMLCETPLPEQTELIEAISQTGKLTGNGNGMQYFGAILIKSELSLEELETYYSDYRSNEWEYLVEIQEGQSIKVIEHKALQFSEEIEDSGYYIVYSWGSGNSLLKELDIRGHSNGLEMILFMKKNKVFLDPIGLICAIVLILGISFSYITNYKKVTIDTSNSPDGKYELILQAVGEPH